MCVMRLCVCGMFSSCHAALKPRASGVWPAGELDERVVVDASESREKRDTYYIYVVRDAHLV